MATPVTINNILAQVKMLNKDDQLTLLEHLVQLIKETRNTADQPVRLSSIGGLGQDVWKNVNIESYLEQERQW